MIVTAAGMLNTIGLQNIGLEAVIAEKAPIWATWDVPVFVNLSGNSVEEYREMAARLDGVSGVAGIELNISCPNVKQGGIAFGTNPMQASEVTHAARQATSLPLIVKLSPNVSAIPEIAKAVQEAGADAISVMNTVYGMAIDIRRRAPALAGVTGGLSGPAIKPYALYLTFQVAQAVTIPVIGIGGILSATDALEFMMAGASAVQLGTALLLDPFSWHGIIEEMRAWCSRTSVPDISQIVGAANPEFLGRQQETGEHKLAGTH
jgi:dihydroorotate dehydrogenase (NAD+) catalytic subunit